ncbi:MAG: hypothetical protein ACYCRD_06540 [Leptospirillum sp.]
MANDSPRDGATKNLKIRDPGKRQFFGRVAVRVEQGNFNMAIQKKPNLQTIAGTGANPGQQSIIAPHFLPPLSFLITRPAPFQTFGRGLSGLPFVVQTREGLPLAEFSASLRSI